MKLTTMALVCLLLVGTWLQDGDSWSLHVSSSNCCFTSVRKAISPKSILCYRNSSSSCSHQDRLMNLVMTVLHPPRLNLSHLLDKSNAN
ncbi:C-C motif chemokine 1 [Myotis brandtii]|uniref:C-C motif chemokine 1 n=1 Tax=Myotis brandtii TaxID=109478 RepID=S7PEV9_MYOBR|nr:C-C motif chemokine 1 [Myotis brandtii]